MASDKFQQLKNNIDTVIFDIDWVFTNWNFIYTADWKVAKIFWPHDADGVKLLRKYNINIQCISADKRWYPITKKRIQDDMKLPLENITEVDRIERLKNNFNLSKCIYMWDWFTDAKIFPLMGYSIAPSNAFYLAKEKADYVTKTPGWAWAVLEAVLHIMDKFYDIKFE